jgi:hypothetical protein
MSFLFLGIAMNLVSYKQIRKSVGLIVKVKLGLVVLEIKKKLSTLGV